MPPGFNQIFISLAIFIGGSIFSLISAKIIGSVLRRIAALSRNETDDFIFKSLVKTIPPAGCVVSAGIGWKLLDLNHVTNHFVFGIGKLILIVLLIRLVNKIGFHILNKWALTIGDEGASSMIRSLAPMLRAVVWCIGIVIFLQNIGVQMAAIWAVLSAGGIGAGLALKEPVQEFFDYITILLDKPFENGQFINIGSVWASVERVGVRSTRLRSINGEAIVMSNSSLTSGIISNYAEMGRRRLVKTIGVTYDTSREKMQKIPSIIKSIIDSTNDAQFDRCHFVDFADSSLNLQFVYYIPTNDYLRAMNAQQAINLEIMKCFEEECIDFAFPTQTIEVVNTNKPKG